MHSRNRSNLHGQRAFIPVLVLALCASLRFAPNTAAATPGWAGEQLISTHATGDGWEPAIAADPYLPYVYAGWMQFSGNKVNIAVRVSADGGATWGTPKPICATCGSQAQYDIVLATSTNGTVFATYMQRYKIGFSKSADHGATWSAPVTVSGSAWGDKPWIAVSADGTKVYIVWTSRGNLFATTSTDGGASFSAPLRLTKESGIYYFANGGTVLPNGTVVMVASEYPESGNNTKIPGQINITVFRSTNAGVSWTRSVPDVVSTGASYATSSVTTVASDNAGTLILVYSGSTAAGANGKVWIRRSIDSGATWSAAAEMTTFAGGADATSVAAAGNPVVAGQFTITWMDARGGGWNVWQSGSLDGGLTWSADAKVSDATSGAAYKTSAGFGLPFGDYNMITINSAGKTVTVSGEGDAAQTHGDIWVNRQF